MSEMTRNEKHACYCLVGIIALLIVIKVLEGLATKAVW